MLHLFVISLENLFFFILAYRDLMLLEKCSITQLMLSLEKQNSILLV
jgi:hypothetical protein